MRISHYLENESRFVQSFLFAVFTVVLYWPLRWLDLAIETRLIGPQTDPFGALVEMFTLGPIYAFVLGFLLQLAAHAIRTRVALAILCSIVVVMFFQFSKYWV